MVPLIQGRPDETSDFEFDLFYAEHIHIYTSIMFYSFLYHISYIIFDVPGLSSNIFFVSSIR